MMSSKTNLSPRSSGLKTDPSPSYGLGKCRPRYLQFLANPIAFTANLGIIIFLQVCIFSYAIGIVRTLEKRFSLRSQQTGILNSTNDIVQVVFVLLIGYVSRKSHKPRMLSTLLLVLAVGCFMYAVPYFLFGSKESIINRRDGQRSETDVQENLVCNVANSTEDALCHAGNTQLVESNHTAFIIFVLSAILIGFGGSGLQVMGISYIDENVKSESVSLYLGAATAMFPLGPVGGFLIAALATSLPENLKHSALQKDDPAFIGAWWLGYVIFPCLLFIFSICLFFFPKHFPEYYIQKSRHRRGDFVKKDKRTSQAEATSTNLCVKGMCFIWKEIKDFPKTVVRLLKRPEFVTNIMGNVCAIYMIVGLGVNMTRYMEIAFLQPAFIANIITAIAGAASGVIGNLLGGVIMKRLRLQVQGAALMHSITTFIGVVFVLILLLIQCPSVKLASEPEGNGLLNVDLACASNCTCPRDLFLPVCGKTLGDDEELMTFLSPCHAGCQSVNGSWSFTNCSCLASFNETTTKGTCEESCKVVYTYAIVMFCMSLIMSMGRVPTMIVSLRVVDQDLRTFALGFQSFVVNLLAFIPAPIIYGLVTDSTCLVWSENCGKRGNCLFYDTNKYRIWLHGMTLLIMGIGFLFILLTWFLIKRNTAKGLYDVADSQVSSSQDIASKTDSSNETETNNENSLKEEMAQKTDVSYTNNILSDTHM